MHPKVFGFYPEINVKQDSDKIRFTFQKDGSDCRIRSKGVRLNAERLVRKLLRDDGDLRVILLFLRTNFMG